MTHWNHGGAALRCVARTLTSILALATLSGGPTARAQDATPTVRLPLDAYDALRNGNRDSGSPPGLAYSNAEISATITENEDGATARIRVRTRVRILGEEEWTFVPLPAGGHAVTSASADGQAASLVARGGVMAWPTHDEGEHQLEWTYSAPVRSHGRGRVLSVASLPTTVSLNATVPVADRGLTVVPASSSTVAISGGVATVNAQIPPTEGFSLGWRSAAMAEFTVSRASYRGRLEGDTLRFDAELSVELAGEGPVSVPLFPSHVALASLSVDRTEAPISVVESRFAVRVRGRGRHRVQAAFEVPVARGEGQLPHVNLSLTPTPVSRFSLELPGDREVTVTPLAGVRQNRARGSTRANFVVPMTESVSIRWAEAVPDGVSEVEMRSHANLVHVVRPDEGVLTMNAYASWEVTRGSLRQVDLHLPEGVQINRVHSDDGVVNDWRVTGAGRERRLTVFLDREVRGSLRLEIGYERAWSIATRTSEAFDVPLLRALGVQRQRGMVALLSLRELTLTPRREEHVTRVGDNLIPADIRNEISSTVAHTFRYLDEAPQLTAIGAAREPEPPRFDVDIDTLVSLGDVSTTLSVLAAVEVKSGEVDRLVFGLPEGLNVLEVSAPSLRQHRVVNVDGDRSLVVELTQPMEGRFQLEIQCERISGQDTEVNIPLVSLNGAEVERGRLGVEALAAFQVDVSEAQSLSPLDPSALPERILLRTDNPILHAYRYAQASEPPRFTVRITRHQDIETPHAVIDHASFRTVYTRSGVAVTIADLLVRNRSQQFLRITLPGASSVWSARVDGQAQTPALENGSEDSEPTVLINIVSAADAFPVQLVYATPAAGVGSFGRVSTELPRLRGLVVTQTDWEIVLPSGVTYAPPSSGMDLRSREVVDGAALAEALNDVGVENEQFRVPADGIRYVFRQMYVDQNRSAGPRVSVAYMSGWAQPTMMGLSGLGALLLWLGLLGWVVARFGLRLPIGRGGEPVLLFTYRDNAVESDAPESAPPPRGWRFHAIVVGVVALGTLLLATTLVYLSVSATPAFVVTGLIGLALAGLYGRYRMLSRAHSDAERQDARAPVALDEEGEPQEQDEEVEDPADRG